MTLRISKTLPTQRRRSGITIVEMIVVITIVAAMLTLCALLLQMLMKVDADSRARRDGSVVLGRLTEQFRDDLHAARTVTLVDRPSGAKTGLRLQRGADRTVEYQADGGSSVVRVESERGKPVRRERYEIPRSDPIALGLDHEGGREFARLVLNRRGKRNQGDPPRSFQIVALVGKNKDRTAGGGKP
jgi:type II secretory pathway pseudopilin PulG